MYVYVCLFLCKCVFVCLCVCVCVCLCVCVCVFVCVYVCVFVCVNVCVCVCVCLCVCVCVCVHVCVCVCSCVCVRVCGWWIYTGVWIKRIPAAHVAAAILVFVHPTLTHITLQFTNCTTRLINVCYCFWCFLRKTLSDTHFGRDSHCLVSLQSATWWALPPMPPPCLCIHCQHLPGQRSGPRVPIIFLPFLPFFPTASRALASLSRSFLSCSLTARRSAFHSFTFCCNWSRRLVIVVICFWSFSWSVIAGQREVGRRRARRWLVLADLGQDGYKHTQMFKSIY